jgi:hypothetical protein
MNSDIDQLVTATITLLRDPENSPEDLERLVLGLTDDAMLARRLIDWIPETFAIVLVSHMGKVAFSGTFSAKNREGKWVEINMHSEPIHASAMRAALEMLHSGPRESFERIMSRSSILAVVNKALNAGESIDGMTLSGPAFIGIPAEVYIRPQKS